MQVAMGLIADHAVEMATVRSILNLLAAEQPDFHGRVIMHQGLIGRLDKARNNVIRTFATLVPAGCEWLLFVDSDMVFTPEDYRKLREVADPKKSPIVSGLYYVDTDPPSPCVFHWDCGGRSKTVEDIPKGKRTVWADAVGMGFLLVHKDVFDCIYKEGQKTNHFGSPPVQEPWCDNGQTGPGGQPLADDMSFCYRATQMGYKIKVVPAARIGHVKTHIIYGGDS